MAQVLPGGLRFTERSPMHRVSLVIMALLLGPSAWAQDEPLPKLEGLELIVVPATGDPSWGASWFTRALRDQMVEAIGPLVPYEALQKAQKELRITGLLRFEPENLARAGKKAGAQYVLSTRITKTGWLYTAQTILVNTESGEVQMDFRSGYYKPRTEAADRGLRTARTTIKKLAILLEEKAAPPPTSATMPPAEEPSAPATPPVTEGQAEAPPAEKPPTETPITEEPATKPPPSTESVTITEMPPPPVEERDFFYANLHLGAALARTYHLSSEAVDRSKLSYELTPLAHFGGGLETLLPGTGFGARAAFSYSPIRFSVVGADGQTATPRGDLVEIDLGVSYHFAVSGSGRDAIEIVPTGGLLIESLSVESQPAITVLSHSALAPAIGVGLVLPVTSSFGIRADGRGALVVSYDESPITTADPKLGFALSGSAEAEFWISESVAILIGGGVTYRMLSFEGAPTRPVPDDEDLTDPKVSSVEVRVGSGVGFRL
jgi:hypothetical protein